MTSVIPTDSPQERRNRRSVLGAALFLVSLGVAFLALFVLYGALRASMPAWPPPGVPRVPVLLPSLNTGLVLASSLTYHEAVVALRRGRAQRFRLLLLVTANLGAAFLVLQAVLARQAIDLGVVVGTSLYAGLLFGLAAFHAVHLLVGVVALGVLAALARRGRFSARGSIQVRLWGYYWHFVGGCWLLMYLLLFVV